MTVDPFALLGVEPGAPLEDVTAAYRRLAKQWHPDRAGDEAARRMVEINAAYEIVRSGAWQQRASSRPQRPEPPATATEVARRVPAGGWLSEAVRRALGPELLSALRTGEEVVVVAPVSVWASPQALLAVTDRRLLWLLDDAVTGRVRTLGIDAITAVQTRLAWPRRRRAVLKVSRRNGRRPIAFSDLRPETAEAIAVHVRSVRGA